MKTTPSTTDDPYHEIVDLYDLEHDEFADDIDILLNFAQAIGGPILEAGCGSGRLLVPLAEGGYRVTGIDSSRPMLDRARQLIAEHGVADQVTLAEADMRELDTVPGGPFALIVFSLNSMMHLVTPEDQRTALDAARRALDPKGQIIIDLMNPAPDQIAHLLDGPHLEGSWMLDDGSAIDKWSHRTTADQPQVLNTLLWYDRTYPNGRLSRTRTSFPLRYIHGSELALMLELAGFIDPVFYGGYDLDPYNAESERLFVTARPQPAQPRRD